MRTETLAGQFQGVRGVQAEKMGVELARVEALKFVQGRGPREGLYP